MSETENRPDMTSKEDLIRADHPLILSIREIPGILFDENPVIHKTDCLSLKELFLKVNMDRYHVDCLVLRKIARNMIIIQEKLKEREIYPGLFALEDIYVDLSDSAFPIYLIHPEKFQMLDFEQDYEWYPEDERIMGDIILFDEKSQARADQRFLYRILIASFRGNVKVPPLTTSQDYSNLFYGTLLPEWKNWFEEGITQSLLRWKEELDEAIRCEESFEKKLRQEKENHKKEMSLSKAQQNVNIRKESEIYCMYVILRTERSNSLEMSRMLYETQDLMEKEQRYGRFQLIQGFVYGDAVIKQRDFHTYERGFRVQIPQQIKEYSIVEGLLIACDWLDQLQQKQKESGQEDKSYRMYILSDGKVENNRMFVECLHKIRRLIENGVMVVFVPGRESSCEGWEQLTELISGGM